MTAILLTWIYIGIMSLILGFTFNQFLGTKMGCHAQSFEMYILTGVVILTVYAQTFSLFSGVGLMANILLVGLCLVFLFRIRKALLQQIKLLNWHWIPIKLLIILAVSFIVAGYTAQMPIHYDTDLYHTQAIRWIEEYGVVPGLGNLHNRFAYNSSFLPVQALFSFKFLNGLSLHTLNGFLGAVFMSYGLISMRILRGGGQKLNVADGLRIVLVMYTVKGLTFISSPNTDFFVLALVLYIFIKWSDYLDNDTQEIGCYGWLCLMAVYACTLKLSAAFIMLLLIKPIYQIFRDRQWKTFGLYVLISAFIAMPFIIRNVIISGYILYPYAQFDAIPFIDWKMNPDAINYDRKEIMVWGRLTFDVEGTYNYSLRQWLPIWLNAIGNSDRHMFGASVFSAIGLLVTSGYFVYKKDYDRLLLALTSVVCLLGWLLTAPLIRYGEVYMWIPCCILFLYWLAKIPIHPSIGNWGLILCLCAVLYSKRSYLADFPEFGLLMPADYKRIECVQNNWKDIIIYSPAEGDQTGYHVFPATPYPDRLSNVELRGETLKEGFRRKSGE